MNLKLEVEGKGYRRNEPEGWDLGSMGITGARNIILLIYYLL